MLTTDQKGAIAETAIMHEAAKLGIEVYCPIAQGGRFDLILLLGSRLVRVQCKWAPLVGDAVAVRCCSSRRAREGFRKRGYAADEIDAYAAHCAALGQNYLLPIELFPNQREIRLRLVSTRNKQRLRVNWAEEYEFAATLGRYGAIAQLGERMPGRHEVAGSSPAGSTPSVQP
jgi:hypothetical protein